MKCSVPAEPVTAETNADAGMTKETAAGTGGANTDPMLSVHKMFRREFAALAREAPAEHDPARTAALEEQLRMVLRVLHLHHCGEDEDMWPLLRRRAPESAAVLDSMEADHEVLDPLIERAGDTSVPLAGRAPVLRELSQRLDAHLDREESEALPLIRRHISEAEFSEMDKQSIKACGKDLPALAGAVLWHATPDERTRLLDAVPAIFGIMWRLSWRRRYARRAVRTYGPQRVQATSASVPG